jgi:hypothetical protein
MVIDDNDFIDERVRVDQLGANAFDDLPNGRLLIASGDADRHRGGSLRRDEFIEIERAGDVGSARAHTSIVGETGSGSKAERRGTTDGWTAAVAR